MKGYSQGRAGLSASLRCADFLRGGRTQRPRAAEGVAVFFRAQPFTNEFAAVSRKKKPTLACRVFVPRTGIEPALPCDNQILSLARLPIPPSGL